VLFYWELEDFINKIIITFIILVFSQVGFGQALRGKLEADQNGSLCVARLSMDDYTSSLISVPLSLFSEESKNVIKSCSTHPSSIEGFHKLITVAIKSDGIDVNCALIGNSEFEFFAENFDSKINKVDLDCSSNEILEYQ